MVTTVCLFENGYFEYVYMFIYVCRCLYMFIDVYRCLYMFVYGYIWLYMFVDVCRCL